MSCQTILLYFCVAKTLKGGRKKESGKSFSAICSFHVAVHQLLHKRFAPFRLNIAIMQPCHNLKWPILSKTNLPCVNVPATSKHSERISKGNFMLATVFPPATRSKKSYRRLINTFNTPLLICFIFPDFLVYRHFFVLQLQAATDSAWVSRFRRT